MQTLDYQTPDARQSNPTATVFLIVLPVCPTVIVFVSALYGGHHEPFYIVAPEDLVIFGGSPIAVLGAGISWCLIARKRSVHWAICLCAILWFALVLYGSVELLLQFLREPWNR